MEGVDERKEKKRKFFWLRISIEKVLGWAKRSGALGRGKTRKLFRSFFQSFVARAGATVLLIRPPWRAIGAKKCDIGEGEDSGDLPHS